MLCVRSVAVEPLQGHAQRRKVVEDGLPNHGVIDLDIVVNDDVAHSFDGLQPQRPRAIGVCGAEVFGICPSASPNTMNW